jgi:phosphonate metabolism protein (transferase hexapeptide repeat family)
MKAPLSRDDEPRIHSTALLKGCRLGRHVSVGERVMMHDVSIGDYSYVERHAEAMYAQIGKFCSIAAATRINAVEHPMERITTHKISYRPNEYFLHAPLDHEFRERRRARRVSIGHDVWIGHGAVIMPGVTIRNGAVIGANAVVTHDVAPYTIEAGVPARPLRRRFPEDLAADIEALAWWDWRAEKLEAAVLDMGRLSPAEFVAKWKEAE